MLSDTSRRHPAPPGAASLSTRRHPLAQALSLALPGALLCASLLVSPSSLAATYQVLNTQDAGSGSLREAIDLANANPGADTITFAASVTGSINLVSGPLEILDSVDIQGPGASTLTINGSTAIIAHTNDISPMERSVFKIGDDGGNAPGILKTRSWQRKPAAERPAAAGDVTISGLTITGGSAYLGGGIAVYGANLEVKDCVITGNTALAAGGGIGVISLPYSAEYSVAITNSVISNNQVAKYTGSYDPAVGGGIFALTSSVSISGSTIADNEAGPTASMGGGMLIATTTTYSEPGELNIVDSTISGNTAAASTAYGAYYAMGVGGGIAAPAGNVSISNSTIHGNTTAAYGGGLVTSTKYGNTSHISNSTVSNNHADVEGGGIIIVADGYDVGAFQIRNSVIAGNTASTGPDLHVLVDDDPGLPNPPPSVLPDFDVAYSLIQTPASTPIIDSGGNIFNQSPLLGPLANNGGPTMTRMPLSGSPLIDAGDPGFSGPPDNDQRGAGYPRVVNGRLDIGAVESAAAPSGGGAAVPVPGLGLGGKLGLGALLGLVAAMTRRRRRHNGLNG